MSGRILALAWMSSLLAGRSATEPKSDAESLRGAWVVTSLKLETFSVDYCNGGLFTFGDASFTIMDKDKKVFMEATYKLDPSKKPKVIDIVRSGGADKGQKLKGIYSLVGGDLKICFVVPNASKGEDRTPDHTIAPPDFEGNVNQLLWVLKKQKAAQ